MSNNLKRDIKAGEEVIVMPEQLKPEFRNDPKEFIFVCHSGFGMQANTMGTKIFGYWKKQGKTEEDYIRGYYIDAVSTKTHQKKSKQKGGRK